MKINSGICAVCGADKGLHHSVTYECPLNGKEETKDGVPQQWQGTTFIDSGIKKLNDAAEDLLVIAKLVLKENEIRKESGLPLITTTLIKMAEDAVRKATL